MRISAVVPCFNGGRYLAEALHSMQCQTRRPDEIVVVDDGSTDDSAAIAESFGVAVLHQENRGDGAARNAGLWATTGDAVAWLDADDRWRPHHLEVVAGLLERHPYAAGAFAAVQRFGSQQDVVLGGVPPGVVSSVVREAFRDWLHTTIGSLVRRPALVEIGGFDEEERSGVDFDLWLRLSRRHRFVATHEVTSDWRMHSEQQSARRDRQVAAVYRYRRRFIDRLRAEGDDALAAELEREFAQIWVDDMRWAILTGDRRTMGVLRAAEGLVPTLAPWDRRSLHWASRAPSATRRSVAVRRAIRARLPATQG